MRLLGYLVAATLVVGCNRAPAPAPAGAGPGAAGDVARTAGSAGAGGAPAHASTGMAHADHTPHHGGLVLMNGDLHFEVVLDPGGRHRIYFSDETRADLPASIASIVTMTVTRTTGAPEAVPLEIDETGESWVARGRAVDDQAAIVRVSYVANGKPYFIDLPWTRPVAR